MYAWASFKCHRIQDFLFCDNIPPAGPPLSQHPIPLMAIGSSGGFSHLQPGVFHISLRTHKTQHTQSRGWKKREQTNTDLG